MEKAKIEKMTVDSFYFKNDKMVFVFRKNTKSQKNVEISGKIIANKLKNETIEIGEDEILICENYAYKVNEYMLKFIKKMLW